MDPRHKATVRTADQTVHGKLAKSKLKTLLETVQRIGYQEIDRIAEAVGPEGKVVSFHSQLYRLGYNVNCIGIFGPELDHVKTRIALQGFTEVCAQHREGIQPADSDGELISINMSCSTRSIGRFHYGSAHESHPVQERPLKHGNSCMI
jgi:hypothetical protein